MPAGADSVPCVRGDPRSACVSLAGASADVRRPWSPDPRDVNRPTPERTPGHRPRTPAEHHGHPPQRDGRPRRREGPQTFPGDNGGVHPGHEEDHGVPRGGRGAAAGPRRPAGAGRHRDSAAAVRVPGGERLRPERGGGRRGASRLHRPLRRHSRRHHSGGAHTGGQDPRDHNPGDQHPGAGRHPGQRGLLRKHPRSEDSESTDSRDHQTRRRSQGDNDDGQINDPETHHHDRPANDPETRPQRRGDPVGPLLLLQGPRPPRDVGQRCALRSGGSFGRARRGPALLHVARRRIRLHEPLRKPKSVASAVTAYQDLFIHISLHPGGDKYTCRNTISCSSLVIVFVYKDN
ncbi:basic salivary proline-rich protein 4-like isoform X1 [Penaeus chinensis]|uniref:basic salivary proline-rich protein 4-like isoform X1 n=1 Tax=Penaeus chinensis TaxID=139456 RepID=UPI001FB726D2|nr:basic salivary proline-rich protein 4-like isoform X1 [Penaeus chinensis]